MKTSTITGALGAFALLASSVGSAATLTVTSDNLTPAVSDIFTVLLTVADVANVGGITMAVAWDDSKATLTASSLPAIGDGPVAIGTGTFLVVTGAGGSRTLDILPGAPPVSGTFNVAVLTFQAIADGAMALVVNDDGGIATGWFDNDTAEAILIDYVQANIQVQVVPAPAALWLLGTGLAGLMVRSARRRFAAA